MKHIIQLKGDDVVDFVFGVKGGVQSYVKHTGKFPSAAYRMHKREGTIEVENVDGATLADAVNKAVSSIQGKRIDYEIVEVEAPAPPERTGTEEAYRRWVEQTQKAWEQKRRAYQKEIDGLNEHIRKLREEKRGLVELRKQDEKRHADLQRSYDSVSKVLEGLAEERVPDPLTACAQWVGDWSVTGFKLEAELREAVGDDTTPHEMADLLESSVEDMITEAANELGDDSIQSIDDLRDIADVVPWEETERHRQTHDDYRRAVEEMQFLQDVNSGETKVPESMRDDIIGRIDAAKNEAVIGAYEDERARYESRTAKADVAASYVAKAAHLEKLGVVVRRLAHTKGLPVAVVCREDEDKWVCETFYPSAESDGMIDEALEDVVSKVMRKRCTGVPEDRTEENVRICRASVPGKYRSWKDVSRFQEKLHGEIAEKLQESVLGSLGIPLTVSKIMSQRA